MKAVLGVAQYYLGLMYFHGKGVAESVDDGLLCFRKASEYGHEDAAEYNACAAARALRCFGDGRVIYDWATRALAAARHHPESLMKYPG